MLIKNIFMELRTLLRSCNVYITTNVDFRKNCNFKISIQANSIILNYYPDDEDEEIDTTSFSSTESLSDCFSEDDPDFVEIIPIDEFCRIIPNSMSGLKIEKNSISFRILTEPKNGGNFYNEFLSSNANNDSKINSNCTKVDVNVSEEIKIICANCVNVISDSIIKFGRVLELPSGNLDISEWFCHNHGNTSHCNDNVALNSQKTDLLYRLSYVVIDKSQLSEKTNKFNLKRDVYHCNRCLAWLGIKSKETVKLFNSTVKITRGSNESRILKYKNSGNFNDVTLNDFIYTIECMTKEFNLGFQYAVMCKMVLECHISADKRQFLLIWVMDKELQVLRNTDNSVATENDDRIKLVSSFLSKILYKVETSLNEEVETWLSDPSVASSEISKNMFNDGVEHLKNMSLKVPESFRITNGYSVSYLKV